MALEGSSMLLTGSLQPGVWQIGSTNSWVSLTGHCKMQRYMRFCVTLSLLCGLATRNDAQLQSWRAAWPRMHGVHWQGLDRAHRGGDPE